MDSSSLMDRSQQRLDVVINDAVLNEAVINKLSKPVHPIKQYLAKHPGTGNYEIAKNIEGMSHCQVFNWLLEAVKNGEVNYELGKYYLTED